MPRSLLWFSAGVLFAVVICAATLLVSTYSPGDARAQGVWQVRQFSGFDVNPNPAAPDPEIYLRDWVVTLPDHCDFMLYREGAVAFYRCP